MSMSEFIKVLWSSCKSGSLEGDLFLGLGYDGMSFVSILGFNCHLGAFCIIGMCSIRGFEPTAAWVSVVISDFCLSGFGTTCAGLLGCGGVTTLIFLLKPALPFPKLGSFQVGVFVSGVTAMGFNVYFSDLTYGFMPFSTPCTSGKVIPLDLNCDLVCIKYFSPTLYYNTCHVVHF